MNRNLAVIPARGGSKGIPRKSIRPVAGKPMIFYAITACLKSNSIDEVVVSTDDDEIALLSERFGATVLMRDPELAQDATTLDPVIEAAVLQAEEQFRCEFDFIYTVQPTSPLIQAHDLDRAAQLFESSDQVDTVLTVVDDRHLCWTMENGQPQPLYSERVNRQSLPYNYRETGAIIACSRKQLRKGSRIGEAVQLLEMPAIRSFDIDNFSDLYLCESILNRKKIVFTVVGYPEVGLGHAFRAIMLAHELVNYELLFLCEKKSELAANYISGFNYDVEVCIDGALAKSIGSIKPDLVINDILDTSDIYMHELASTGCKIINFEDLGSGASQADLVVNALYPHQQTNRANVLVGPHYFCLREEFLHSPIEYAKNIESTEVLITFGGVDEGNLTLEVVKLLAENKGKVRLTIVTGPGYKHINELSNLLAKSGYSSIQWIRSTNRISDYMFNADFAITSAGRTVLELVSTETPMISICQNEREMTHTFANEDNGVINLGLYKNVSDKDILSAVEYLMSGENRQIAIEKMKKLDLTKGKLRVISKIKQIIG